MESTEPELKFERFKSNVLVPNAKGDEKVVVRALNFSTWMALVQMSVIEHYQLLLDYRANPRTTDEEAQAWIRNDVIPRMNKMAASGLLEYLDRASADLVLLTVRYLIYFAELCFITLEQNKKT